MKKRPWYRSDGFLTFLCILLPPIGYIAILANKKHLKHENWVGLLFVATIIISIWLIKFLPGQWGTIIILTGAGIYGYHKILNKITKRKGK